MSQALQIMDLERENENLRCRIKGIETLRDQALKDYEKIIKQLTDQVDAAHVAMKCGWEMDLTEDKDIHLHILMPGHQTVRVNDTRSMAHILAGRIAMELEKFRNAN